MKKRLKNEQGMTLLEIMIVVAIIGGLMAVVAPRIFNAMEKANFKQAALVLKGVIEKIEMYRNDCNQYPPELKYLMEEPPASACSGTWGPEAYVKVIPKDPWGTELVYEVTDNSFILKSLGKDKREGGSGFAKDISSDDENFDVTK